MKLSISGVEIEIENFTEEDYESVRGVLRDSLNRSSCKNRDAIKNAFADAVRLAPDANPSDLWHHIVYRSYLEMVTSLRPVSDSGQSWKRASGDAFEIFIADYYNPLLGPKDIQLEPLIGKSAKVQALKSLGIFGKVGDSKLDIVIRRQQDLIGAIHAKVSLAERVSDDEPASIRLMENGYVSYLVTLDVKSFPLSHTVTGQRAYINKGELGTPENPIDKRQYIEEHGSFDACFSYNLRTVSSLASTNSGKKIYAGKFDGSWDKLCETLLSANKKTH